jgi:CMP-N-acetylneuraminate monooxygenase
MTTERREIEVDLGPQENFEVLPVRVTIEGEPYYVSGDVGGYRLLSTVCPHMAGEVVDSGTVLECRHHGWRFDRLTGEGVNVSGSRLTAHPVSVRDGRLVAQMPTAAALGPLHRSAAAVPAHLRVTLHAHACLEIVHRGFSLLTDPWLSGPAFLGAWTQYPPRKVDVAGLRPDAIWISHEHSDHFHEPTLTQFDRAVPIYVPDFPNRRMVERLASLGFTNVNAMRFGETCELRQGLSITCFEPASSWNDAIVLYDIEGFRLLNLNDAGLNRRIARLLGPVDAIATGYSAVASGYPLTWEHLTLEQKIDIMDRAAVGMIEVLRDAVRLYGAKYLLPFASHFGLWHPSHREYARIIRKLSLDDVKAAFDGSDIAVIDLMPGETWSAATGGIQRTWPKRQSLYYRDNQLRILERQYDETVFRAHHPQDDVISREALETYLLALNDVPEIAFCEDLTVEIVASEANGSSNVTVRMAVARGQLTIVPPELSPWQPALRMQVPTGVLARIVRDGLSWDEAHIGFWCRFSRDPDVYHAGFWRLLQAPYYAKHVQLPRADRDAVGETTLVGDVVERYGASADRVLRRYGLYCVGCQHSASDSLIAAAHAHGVEPSQVANLLVELRRLDATETSQSEQTP